MRSRGYQPQFTPVAIMAGAAALVLEATAVGAFAHRQPLIALAFHLVASLALASALRAAYVGREGGAEKARFWGVFGGLMAFFTPLYGTVVLALLMVCLRYFPPPPGDLLSEFVEHVAPQDEGEGGAHRVRAGDLRMVDHLQVEPLIDMLSTDDVDLKRAVIDAMARRRGSKLIAAIQECLQDPRPEIYQYAMAKLGRLQEDFTRDISHATVEIEKRPGETEPHLRLARLYEQYLESGLVDPTLIDFYRGQLLREYDGVLAANPAETASALARGRLLVELGRAEEATQEFRRVLERDPENIEALFGMVAAHFALHDWRAMQGEVGAVLRLSVTRSASNPQLIELAQWLGGRMQEAELPPAEEAIEALPGFHVPRTRLRLPETRLRMSGAEGAPATPLATAMIRPAAESASAGLDARSGRPQRIVRSLRTPQVEVPALRPPPLASSRDEAPPGGATPPGRGSL